MLLSELEAHNLKSSVLVIFYLKLSHLSKSNIGQNDGAFIPFRSYLFAPT